MRIGEVGSQMASIATESYQAESGAVQKAASSGAGYGKGPAVTVDIAMLKQANELGKNDLANLLGALPKGK